MIQEEICNDKQSHLSFKPVTPTTLHVNLLKKTDVKPIMLYSRHANLVGNNIYVICSIGGILSRPDD